MLTASEWVSVMLVSAIVAIIVTLPLRHKLNAMESMLEMLRKMVTGKYDDVE